VRIVPQREGEVSATPEPVACRPFRVYDGDGAFVGDFAGWLAAHQWAHQRAAEPGTRLPVEIEDRSRLHTEQVWPDRCQTLHAAEPVTIPTCPLAAVGEPALRVLPGGLDDNAAASAGRTTPGRASAARTAEGRGRL
jgi:hypothetical protein